MSIRTKLLISILITVCVIFSGIEYLSYKTSKNALEKEIQVRATNMLAAKTVQLDNDIQSLQSIAEGLKIALESVDGLNEDGVKKLIQNFLETQPNAYGAAVAFEPNTFGNTELVGHYYFRTKKGLEYVDLARPAYNYPNWDWYKTPVKTKEPLWTPPYKDSGGGDTIMTTFACPFFKDGSVWGVATVDVAVSKLTKIVEDIKVGSTGFAFLVEKSGEFLSMRRADFSKLTIFDAAKQFGSNKLDELGREMIDGGTGYMSFIDPLDDQESWFAYAPIPSTGWSLGIVLPENELMAELTSLHRRIVFFAVAGLLLIFIIVFIISNRISAPIKALSEAARGITKGNFTVKLPVNRSNDEVGVLARTFAEMGRSLEEAMGHISDERDIFRVALSHLTEGVVILNPRWNVLQSNSAAEKLLKFPVKGTLIEHLESFFESSIPLPEFTNVSRERASFKLKQKECGISLDCSIAPLYGEGHRLKERVLTIRTD